jgi:hypothetical protein
VGNLKSVVRNYSLQSQIFPEQSSIIAIGSQAQGGQLGMQNNTMIDFNKSLIDRIIPKKDFGIASNAALHKGKLDTALASNLGGIIFMFATLQQTETAPGSATDISTLFNRCKSNLRDLIVYFQSITKSPGANRNIIPFKFSFEMDGIGGLVIGNLFTVNQDILPKGYKGAGVGVTLAQTVTGISHTLSNNNDWTTKIDALNIVLGDGPNTIEFKDLDLATLIDTSFKNSLASQLPPPPGFDPTKLLGGLTPLFTGKCTAPDTDKAGSGTLTSRGWAGKQVPKVKTVINPVVEAPKLTAKFGKLLGHSMLACAKIEQSFEGYNWNLGGFDLTNSGFNFDPKYYNGYYVSSEGLTGACKAFGSFISFDLYLEKKADLFIKKGLDKVTTAEEFGKIYYKDWFGGDGGTAAVWAKYPKVRAVYATLDDYRKAAKATQKACYTETAKYFP